MAGQVPSLACQTTAIMFLTSRYILRLYPHVQYDGLCSNSNKKRKKKARLQIEYMLGKECRKIASLRATVWSSSKRRGHTSSVYAYARSTNHSITTQESKSNSPQTECENINMRENHLGEYGWL
ncbi:uncharacterized protein MEPE_06267 [Melanopsichium pennsylvanicum]|uniref:Uncharacterized protein n=1 Tax=Melanopsichium pennsylvanicum TaxID=63383 RepID=A0AAJ5C831_9BASI|nr:uncharacterized protein MEPE_06267 [Melanopsichium pennsylvanicum]